jgi:hypothetical protein
MQVPSPKLTCSSFFVINAKFGFNICTKNSEIQFGTWKYALAIERNILKMLKYFQKKNLHLRSPYSMCAHHVSWKKTQHFYGLYKQEKKITWTTFFNTKFCLTDIWVGGIKNIDLSWNNYVST